MSTNASRPNVDEVLASLKDFQRTSVDYVFRRLYLDSNRTRRFLVADEVGLGKTHVARGLIAQAVDHVWDRVDRIDIVYICSNADIANQNVRKLELPPATQRGFVRAVRPTLLPLLVHELERSKVNFISFTPTLAFDLQSRLGRAGERALLLRLLEQAWSIGAPAARRVLQGKAGDASFRETLANRSQSRIDPSLAEQFIRALRDHDEKGLDGGFQFRPAFEDLCDRFRLARRQLAEDDLQDRARFVGRLRDLLARTCIDALRPDLIILDEFQRFKELLSGESEAAKLAQAFFSYADDQTEARVPLLSAPPYKMYTLAQDAGDEDHYSDFMDTLRFLLQGAPEGMAEVEGVLREYRRTLYRIDQPGALDRLRQLKAGIEASLRQVMVRTERLGASDDRNGMLVQKPVAGTELDPTDLGHYVALQRVADALDEGDMLAYWKSAPYLLNFMDDYQMKHHFKSALEDPEREPVLRSLLRDSSNMLFPHDDWRAYEPVPPGNARLRGLVADTVDSGLYRLLWLPPSLPYYELAPPFRDFNAAGVTKRLVFSAWRVVPKAVASLVSYEAERRMMHAETRGRAENSPEARRRRGFLLRFPVSRGRPGGMLVFALLYPSPTLARVGDPLQITAALLARKHTDASLPPLDEVLSEAERRIDSLLQALPQPGRSSGGPDDSWYWLAPLLLDFVYDRAGLDLWFTWDPPDEIWTKGAVEAEEDEPDGAEPSQWAEHVQHALQRLSELKALDGNGLDLSSLGPQPADLARVLAQVAVGGPAVCALRALARVATPGPSLMTPDQVTDEAMALRDGAARIAWAFRSLFNLPEVTASVRSAGRDEPYWRQVLTYCTNGCLQAVLDEYAHVLRDAGELTGEDMSKAIGKLADAVRETLQIRTTNHRVDIVSVSQRPNASVNLTAESMRARFAMRFGTEAPVDDKGLVRHTHVKDAFNSPFWPFVLATTSVGQEGLDFHRYCHAVVHWDLPSNPVDLEQREGRVHRYKGHAVRKNVALVHGPAVLRDLARRTAGEGAVDEDVWHLLFEAAERARPPGTSDLVPYWVYTAPNGAAIERYTMTLPLTREVYRLASLRRSLAVYRMVFGQPRQDDLLQYLLERLPEEKAAEVLRELRIDLGPVG